MCRQVRCTSCGKAGWAGCGAHVEQVLAGVPKDERCRCREESARDTAKATADGRPRSWLAKILGR